MRFFELVAKRRGRWDAIVDVLIVLDAERPDYFHRVIQNGLDALRIELAKHCQAAAPWRARDAIDVILTLDALAWATLLGLIDECPVLHAGSAASRDAR